MLHHVLNALLPRNLVFIHSFKMVKSKTRHEVEQKYDAYKMKKVRANHICASYKQAINQIIGILKRIFLRKLYFIFNINKKFCSLFTP